MAAFTSYWGLDGIILFLLAIAAAYAYMTRKFTYWTRHGVLEVPPTAFLGNVGPCLFQRVAPGDFLRDIYNFGKGLPFVGFYLFDKPALLLRSPEIIKNVLVKDFNSFADRYVSASDVDTLGSNNLFVLRNPSWKLVRTKLSPIFTSGKLKKMFELMLEINADLEEHIGTLIREGKNHAVDMKELSAMYTTDLIGTTAFGLKVNSLNDPQAEFRKSGKNIFTYTARRNLEFFVLFFTPKWVKHLGFRFFTPSSTRFFRESFWETITERMKSGIKRYDLIDLLIELKKSEGESPTQDIFEFDGDNLVAQACVFFMGGFETSSTVISYSLYHMALNMDVQQRLRSEIMEALEHTDGKVTYDMVLNLPYLDMVVAETLRMYPPLPFLDRTTIEDYKVPESDVIIEKGTPIFIGLIGLHYDPEHFPDPQKWDPERFSPENKKTRTPFTYLPFGDGPHNCIGFRLGYLQSKLGLIQLISKYEITTCEQTPIPVMQDPKALFVSPTTGLYLNIRKL